MYIRSVAHVTGQADTAHKEGQNAADGRPEWRQRPLRREMGRYCGVDFVSVLFFLSSPNTFFVAWPTSLPASSVPLPTSLAPVSVPLPTSLAPVAVAWPVAFAP